MDQKQQVLDAFLTLPSKARHSNLMAAIRVNNHDAMIVFKLHQIFICRS